MLKKDMQKTISDLDEKLKVAESLAEEQASNYKEIIDKQSEIIIRLQAQIDKMESEIQLMHDTILDKRETIDRLYRTINVNEDLFQKAEKNKECFQKAYNAELSHRNAVSRALVFLKRACDLVQPGDFEYLLTTALLVSTNPLSIPDTVVDQQGKVKVDEGRVLEFLRNEKKIMAIKYWRETTGMGLKEAKEAVEDFMAKHGY